MEKNDKVRVILLFLLVSVSITVLVARSVPISAEETTTTVLSDESINGQPIDVGDQEVNKDDSHIKIIAAERALSLDEPFGTITPKDSGDVILRLRIQDTSQIVWSYVKIKGGIDKIYVMAGERQCEIVSVWPAGHKSKNEYYLNLFSVPQNVLDMKLFIPNYKPISFKAEKKIHEKLKMRA